MASLPIGQWEITAELPGFRHAVQTGVVLEIGRTIDLQFRLKIGQVTEEIPVVASAPLLQSTTAEISDVIENRQVEQIPLNGRQFLQLAQLSDAVVIPPGGTRGAALQQAGPLPNVGGQRAGHNIYLLDGVKITDELFNNLVINPSVDSIQEFKIQKSMYPPKFGGKASALINVSTKSGANVFSGSGFAFIRDERFDAHNFFDPNQLRAHLQRAERAGDAVRAAIQLLGSVGLAGAALPADLARPWVRRHDGLPGADARAMRKRSFANSGALPERRVTLHSGDMGNTFSLYGRESCPGRSVRSWKNVADLLHGCSTARSWPAP